MLGRMAIHSWATFVSVCMLKLLQDSMKVPTPQAMPWLRQLVAGLLLWRPGFTPRSVHWIFGGQSSTGTGFSLSSSVLPRQYHSTMALHSHVSSGGWTIGPLVAAVERHILTPSPWATLSVSRHLEIYREEIIYLDLGKIKEAGNGWYYITRNFMICTVA
jgi:hypothetical protein